MPRWKRFLFFTLSIATFLAACGPQAVGSRSEAGTPANSLAAPRGLVASIMGQPPGMSHARTNPPGSGGSVPGIDGLEELLVSGLSTLYDQGVMQPLLATQVPTVENGAWKVLPDGRMEMTWTIRDGARW